MFRTAGGTDRSRMGARCQTQRRSVEARMLSDCLFVKGTAINVRAALCAAPVRFWQATLSCLPRLCGLYQQTMVRQEDPDKCLVQVVTKMSKSATCTACGATAAAAGAYRLARSRLTIPVPGRVRSHCAVLSVLRRIVPYRRPLYGLLRNRWDTVQYK